MDALAPGRGDPDMMGASGLPVSAVGVPGLQDLQGSWSGKVQVFGDPTGATNIDFALLGEDWRWVVVAIKIITKNEYSRMLTAPHCGAHWVISRHIGIHV